MTVTPEISDRQDPRLAPFRDLSNINSKTTDQLVVEGKHLVTRMLASRTPVKSVLVSKRHAEEFEELTRQHEAELLVVTDELLHGVVGFKFHRGVLAAGPKPQPACLKNALASRQDQALFVICPEVRDAENLGSIMRTAAALGAHGMIVGTLAADPYCRRAVRVSMGALFSLPIFIEADWNIVIQLLRDQDFQIIATLLSPQARSLHQINSCQSKIAVVLGSEADGLSGVWLQQSDLHLRIPMASNVDSLNVAVAGGIVLHDLKAKMSGRG